MARLTRLRVQNYRSIGNAVDIAFPANAPLVLLGQNNSGKSNIVKALELVLGGFWPGNHEPDEHEFFRRNSDNPIAISVFADADDAIGRRYVELRWRYTPARGVSFKGYDPLGEEGWIRADDRETCFCVVLEAERNLRYQLSYSSKWTYLSRLMHRFHKSLSEQGETRAHLEGLFAQIKTAFQGVPEFAEFTGQLRAQLEDLVGGMTHRLEVDFEAYNPINFFHALRLQAAEGDTPRALEEMGTGEQQILALAFAYAYAQAFHGGIVLVVEEPEAHLHPLAQDWLARRLTAMAHEGLQVIVTTHSPSYVDVLNLEGLVLVTKPATGTQVKQVNRYQFVDGCLTLGAPAGRITTDNVLPFYAASATRDLLSGLFAKAVVLVEGPTEALALPAYFEKCGLQVAREGVAVVPVQGKGNFGKWRRLFVTYGIPCYIIFDNDGADDGGALKRRDALRAVGVADAQHDQYTDGVDWFAGQHFAVFGIDFETTLRGRFPAYALLEADARAAGIDSKPFIGRWVAERLDRDDGAPGWEGMQTLTDRVRALLEDVAP